MFWTRHPTNNFKLKICLFGATKIASIDHSVYGLAFDRIGSWTFCNDFARNFIILAFIMVHYLTLIIAKVNF